MEEFIVPYKQNKYAPQFSWTKRQRNGSLQPRLRDRAAKKKERKQRKCKKKSKYHSSLWHLQENISYMRFLLENEVLFSLSTEERKIKKINVLMSKVVKTRCPDQCRSHHQKMMKHHSNIPEIIQHIKRLMGEQSIDEEHKQEVELQHQIIAQKPIQLNFELKHQLQYQLNDLEHYFTLNEKEQEERHVEAWMQGVQDKYGNL